MPVVWGSSWSAPAWMKDNGEVANGGFLLAEHYGDYAGWLATWVEEMERQFGVTYAALSPQNEPGAKPWASMEWRASAFNVFLRDHLGPTWDDRGLGATSIVASEETYWNKVDDFASVFMADPVTRDVVDVIGGHAYEYNPNSTSRPTRSYNGYGKPVWETEWSYDVYADDVTIGNGVEWALNVWSLLVEAEVSAVHHWWLVNFHDDGRQQGLINAVEGEEAFETTKRLFTIGQFSRFVRPGWVRVEATKRPHSDVALAAFRHPTSGEFAVVAINEGTASRTVSLAFDGFTSGPLTPTRTSASESLATLGALGGGGGVAVTLPAQSVTTFAGTAGAATAGDDRPAGFALGVARPNPSAGGDVAVGVTLGEPAEVAAVVYDALGREVARPPAVRLGSGVQTLALPVAALPPGVYVYRVVASGTGGSHTATGRLVVGR